MMAADGPVIELRHVLLTPEAVLGGPRAAGQLRSRVSFGAWVGAFDPGLAPGKEWRRLVRAAGPAARFCHLSIACSFGPESQEEPGTFAEGQLVLELRGDGPHPPVARAIHPLRKEGPTYPTPMTTVSVGAGFAGASLNLSTQRAAANGQKWAIVGFGLHQPAPWWQFLAVPDYPLCGTYKVDVLVELGAGGRPVAQATLDARLMRRHLRWYREDPDAVKREIPLG